MIDATVRIADGRVPVIVGVSSGTPAASIAYAADAAEAGADAIMLLPPLGYRADPRETVAFYRAVADASALPIMAYNNPEASGVDMPAALIARIAAEVDAGRRDQGVLGRRAPDRRAASAAPGSRCSSAATTGRSRASAPARPAGSPASATSRRPSASSSTRPAAPASSNGARERLRADAAARRAST